MEFLHEPIIDSDLDFINLFCKGNCVALCACNTGCVPDDPIT